MGVVDGFFMVFSHVIPMSFFCVEICQYSILLKIVLLLLVIFEQEYIICIFVLPNKQTTADDG